MYTIGEVAKMFGLTVSTLRYYDREGLLLNVKRDASGVRRFDDGDLETLRMIEYLKRAGMQLRDIRSFMAWCAEGDATLEKRRDLFRERRREIDEQLRELEQTRDLLIFKCWYYETAARDGTEKNVRGTRPEDMPPEVRRAFESSHDAKACLAFEQKKGTGK